jgi:hypothetical protein
MIIIGLILLILGLVLPSHVCFVIGLILIIVGLALALAGTAGNAVGGRRHWY